MKQFYSTTVGGMFVAGALFAARIQALDVAPGAPEQQTGIGMHEPAGQATGTQRVAGTVTQIDHRKGFVTLSTSDGAQKLYFPPQTIGSLKKGDRITARYAFARSAVPPALTRAYDVPTDLVEHQMNGTVTKVNHDNGWLYVKTDHARLELHFPPQSVSELNVGDRICLDLGYSRGL